MKAENNVWRAIFMIWNGRYEACKWVVRRNWLRYEVRKSGEGRVIM